VWSARGSRLLLVKWAYAWCTVIRARVSTNLKSKYDTQDFKLYSLENGAANENCAQFSLAASYIHLKMAQPMKSVSQFSLAAPFSIEYSLKSCVCANSNLQTHEISADYSVYCTVELVRAKIGIGSYKNTSYGVPVQNYELQFPYMNIWCFSSRDYSEHC